jgi:basic membrane protein A
MKEYLADGYNVIWSHGSQYFEATSKLAKQNPDVTFIGEFDDKPKEALPNLWVLDRNFHVAFYPIGVLAGAATKSGKIGYVGGLSLPFSYSEVHAINQALKDTGSSAKVTPVWTGDFNEPAKAQQITTQLIGQGNDVIVGSLNLGMVGAFQATKGKDADVVVTAKYTDKSQFDPEHYATSTIYDFTKPLNEMLTKIQAGTTSGYFPLGFDSGVSIQPPKNVSPEVAAKVEKAVADIKAGTITVEKNLTPIK